MNLSIPFKKNIPFKTSIAEICSISLEHDVSINESELLGDFIVSGEYKNLDVNVDTMPFEHVVPFSVALDDDINIETLSYEIEDFTYEVENNDSLTVNIVLHVTAEKIIESPSERIFEKDDVSDDEVLNIINDSEREEKDEEIMDEKRINDIENVSEEVNILNDNIKEDYITYHVHIVKINETIESISQDFKIDKDKLLELNDINTVQVGDKIIIPDLNE